MWKLRFKFWNTLIYCETYVSLSSEMTTLFLFDYRLLLPETCYQSGECVKDGIYSRKESIPCPSGPPATGYWFNVTVEVSQGSAVVRLNGEVVHSESPCFPLVARVGVAAPNGYTNVVSYQKCIISF